MLIITAKVLVIAGGIDSITNTTLDTVQVFDVNGNCSKTLASLPKTIYDMILVDLNGQIVVCGGTSYTDINTICWSYNTAKDSWDILTTMVSYPLQRVGVVYLNKLYIPDDTSATVFDPVTSAWSSWLPSPSTIGVQICSLVWQDGLFIMGLDKNSKYTILEDVNKPFFWYIFVNLIQKSNFRPRCCILVQLYNNHLDYIATISSLFNMAFMHCSTKPLF